MNDKTRGEYKRTTPDPDETTGEALARLQATMARLLDEADAELRDEADGGVAAALIEKDALAATEARPLPPVVTDEMVGRGRTAYPSGSDRLIRAILTAALTEPPARPEGAEEIDEHLRQANAAALGGALTLEQRRALADHLAGFGYRNPLALPTAQRP